MRSTAGSTISTTTRRTSTSTTPRRIVGLRERRCPRSAAAWRSRLYHGRILAIGGERGGGTFTNNEAYDPRTNRWETLAPLPEGRHGTGAAVIGEALYLPAGGPVNGGSKQSDSLFIFTHCAGS
jgi:hypothetical protein